VADACLAVRHATASVSPWRFRKPTGRGSFELLPAARVLTSDPDALIDPALAGHGICQTGLWHALPHLREGRLKLVLAAQHEPGEREIVLHYPHRQFLSARVRTVVDALLAHLAAARELHVMPDESPASWHAGVKTKPRRRKHP
jgi:DNA-binding transcriptional LysR family regulator